MDGHGASPMSLSPVLTQPQRYVVCVCVCVVCVCACGVCATPADSLQRWKQHFSTVLNTSCVFSEELINTFPSYNLRDELGCVPTSKRVERHYQ